MQRAVSEKTNNFFLDKEPKVQKISFKNEQ